MEIVTASLKETIWISDSFVQWLAVDVQAVDDSVAHHYIHPPIPMHTRGFFMLGEKLTKCATDDC